MSFNASMLPHFRKMLKHRGLTALQKELLKRHLPKGQKKAKDRKEKKDGDDGGDGGPGKKDKLIVDATCTPADIAYPTNIVLLNEA